MSGRTRAQAGGILQVPVMMDIQALTHQDFSGLTKDQRKKAVEQLKMVMQLVDPNGRVTVGSDIVYLPDKKVACIDLTAYYQDDEHAEKEADIRDFVEMFSDGYTENEHGDLVTGDQDEVLATGCYEDDEDMQAKFDINRCLECAKNNLKKLQDMIEAVERAKAQGATKLAAIDFNDYDGDERNH